MNNWYICWFFTHIFTGDFNFKGLTARRHYKSFGVKGLKEIFTVVIVTVIPECITETPALISRGYNGISKTTFGAKIIVFVVAGRKLDVVSL
jgi:hypothetical protein